MKEKGITLIALVITIIILIILSGVTLNIILGQNGIIEKAKGGVSKYSIETEKEKLELLKLSMKMNDITLNLDNYLVELEKVKENYNVNSIERIDASKAQVILGRKYQFSIVNKQNENVEIIFNEIIENRPMILEVTGYEGVYDEEEHDAITITKIEPSDATLRYSLNGGEYDTVIPKVKNVGTYSISIEASKIGYITEIKTIEVIIGEEIYTDTSTATMQHTHAGNTSSGGACYRVASTCGAKGQWQDWTDSNGNKTGGEWFCPAGKGHGIIRIGWGDGNPPSCGAATSYAFNCTLESLGTARIQLSNNTKITKLRVTVDSSNISNITYNWTTGDGSFEKLSDTEIKANSSGTYTCTISYKDSKTNASGSVKLSYTK